MNQSQIKKQLKKRRDELLGLIIDRDEAASTVTAEEAEDKQAERLDDEVLAALSHSDRDEVQRIDAALGRLADGSYGTCANCGEAIAPARLAALPDAALCITCAEENGA